RGRLRFACHAAEGNVAADTTRAVADASFLIDPVGIAGRAADCIKAIIDIERGRASGAAAQTAAQVKYTSFRDGLKAVAERARGAADAAMLTDVHGALTELFQQRQALPEAELPKRIEALQTEVEA